MSETSSILLEGRMDCQEAAKTLILGSVGRVYLITQRLETELYNHAEIFDHLVQIATTNRNADIRIIAHDTRVAANQGHCLIHLVQKLPTFAQIRITATPAHQNFRESWLIADDGAYMRIRNPERFEGYYEIDNKLECKSYFDSFIEMWEASEPDQNTRRLSL
ncbi:MAG: hypothetical protein GY896_05245 [Gammaproteobacteria bacterium]|nr:hypothetical protein [Gammaproteobacteria bacterium]